LVSASAAPDINTAANTHDNRQDLFIARSSCAIQWNGSSWKKAKARTGPAMA
jgi:hypothetical protein